MRLAAILSPLLLALPVRSALAQLEVTVGEPIAVLLTAPGAQAIEGRLTEITDDSIFIARRHRRDVRLARGAVKQLYVSRSDGDNGALGAMVGLEAGILVGGAGGVLVAGPRLVGRMLGGLGGAVAGAMIGLIYGEEIGSHQERKTWIETRWPVAPSTPPAPR